METPWITPEESEAGKRALRAAFGRFATGVTVVTALAPDGRRVGLTVNSFSSLSLDPPLLLWSIDNAQPTLGAFNPGAAFAVHVMAAGRMDLVMRFAKAANDKFSGLAVSEGEEGIPLLIRDSTCAIFECRVEALYPGGDHTIVVGRIYRFSSSNRSPILFADGKFGQIVHD